MLPSIASSRAMLLSQPLLSMRTMATKTVIIKSTGTAATAAKSASTYASKANSASRVSSSKPASAYSKSDFSTTGATAFSSSPVPKAVTTPSSFATSSGSGYSEEDDSEINGSSKVGGGNSQVANEAFSSNGPVLKDAAIGERGVDETQDWTRSFAGMAVEPFEKEVAELLMKPLDPEDIEIKPDGILYLPEIKYRRILNKAFGPGGWGLAPRSEHSISPKTISREYALICRGRFVSTARGEQDYFDPNNIATATEGCKSNALMRCCKDLGVASELWDPSFVRKFKRQYCEEAFAEHVITKRKKKLWKRKDQPDFEYPYAKTK